MSMIAWLLISFAVLMFLGLLWAACSLLTTAQI